MRIFLDTSALAKRYVSESGSEQVALRCRQADEIVLSVLCAPELISGFNRLKRAQALSAPDYRGLKKALACDVEQATIVELTPSVVSLAVGCLEKAPLRALDALQLASAMASACELFVTADRRQGAAAIRFKLKTELVGAAH